MEKHIELVPASSASPARAPEVQRDAVRDVLDWKGNTADLAAFYDQWAADYNPDLARRKYAAPASLFRSLQNYLGASNGNGAGKRIEILDAGCGTGLMGKLLHEAGYHSIDGCDLSAKMIEQARQLGVYRDLVPNVDLTKRNEALRDGQYDVTVCCGVFAGPMPGSGLNELVRVTRPGGAVVLSSRRDYCEKTGFPARVKALEREGRIRIKDVVTDAPYIEGETGHYWTLSKC